MTKYYGQLKTKAQAERWAKVLDSKTTEKAKGMASLLRSNWEMIASRPAIQPEIIAEMESDSIAVDRPGSILNRIMNSRTDKQ